MKKTNEVTIKKYYYLALLTLSLYLSPFLILGEDSYIIIKDTLDFSLPNFKTLAESGKIFSDSNTVMNEMMSANRRSFESEFNFVLLLFYFFEPFTAYTINQCIIRLVALIGMYLLLNKYIFYSQNYLYNLIISLLYSLLPFYSLIGLSVAGLPLITFFFLNIRNKKDNKRDWFGIILFPFYSSFIYSIIFYIIFLLIIWIHDVYKNKSLKKFSIAILIFFSLFIFVNYRLFDQIFFEQSFVSHRVEMETKNYNLFLAIPLSIKHFFFGHIHTLSLHIFFLPLILFVFFVQFFRASKYKLFLILLCVNGFISLWYGFGGSGFFWSINNFLNAYGSPDIKRFYYLSPFIWYVLFAMSVKYLLSNYNFKFTKTICAIIV